MKEDLILRNLRGYYLQKNKGVRYQVYYDNTKNNIVLLIPADKDVDPEDIVNGISNAAYDYLINTLNDNDDLVVCWSAVSGTTSDYTIYYNACTKELSNKTYKEILKYLHTISGECKNTMKYNEVKNKIMTSINMSK